MSITIVEEDFEAFFKAPENAYPRGHYVNPLKSDLKRTLDRAQNPFFKRGELTYFAAIKDGRPVGRIVAHVFHGANEKWGTKLAYFGFFDCIDEQAVADALLSRAEDFGRQHGCEQIAGNFNLQASQEMGVLVGGDERPPMLAMLYGPAHVSKLLEGAGYTGRYPMQTYVNDDFQSFDPERALHPKHRALLDDDDYTFRQVDMSRYDEEVEGVRQLINAAMENNAHFAGITREEMKFQMGPMKAIIDPSIVRIAEHDGEMVGATLAAPDVVPLLKKMKSRIWPFGWWHFLMGRKKLKGCVAIIIVVRPDHQAKGVIGVLNYQMLKAVKAGGYTSVGGTWIADDNLPSRKQTEYVDMKPLFQMRIYDKEL